MYLSRNLYACTWCLVSLFDLTGIKRTVVIIKLVERKVCCFSVLSCALRGYQEGKLLDSMHYISIQFYASWLHNIVGSHIILLLSLCYLAPQSDGILFWSGTCRYAYSEETGDDFDEEGVSLTSGAVKVSGDTAAMREFTSGLAEDLEEDKRE